MNQSAIEKKLSKHYDDYICMTASDVIYEQSTELYKKIKKDKIRMLNRIKNKFHDNVNTRVFLDAIDDEINKIGGKWDDRNRSKSTKDSIF